MMLKNNLWVVVPFYNEAKGIRPTIEALAKQTDNEFALLFVDNASTDGGAEKVRAICQSLHVPYKIIYEPEKGTGAAADTGFRYAIAYGAIYIARTDADCIPAVNWVQQIKAGFASGLEFMGGRLKLRDDDVRLRPLDHLVIPALISIGVLYGRLFYRGKQFKYPFFMAAGGNMAITAHLYERAGGFVRSSIADTNEDTMLAEKVRTLTTCAKYRRELIVHASIRRVRTYGYINTLRWFSDRNFRGEVDVRL
jgi:glycosyltransferase involved in cell wall biosynthesis